MGTLVCSQVRSDSVGNGRCILVVLDVDATTCVGILTVDRDDPRPVRGISRIGGAVLRWQGAHDIRMHGHGSQDNGGVCLADSEARFEGIDPLAVACSSVA